MLDAREKEKRSEEKSSSDKENDDKSSVPKMINDTVTKTYSKKTTNNQAVLKQKVLSATNGSLGVHIGKTEDGVKENSTPSLVKMENKEEVLTKIERNTEESDDKRNVKRPWGVCSADMENCVVHSSILPKTYWSYYGTIEDVDTLIECLNDRGYRESELKDKLANERDRLAKSLKRMNNISDKLCSETSSIVKQESEATKLQPKVYLSIVT